MNAPVFIAIADDHELVRKGLMSLLQQTNDRFTIVAEAGNGKELLEQIQKATVLPDICLVDAEMPVMNGYETTMNVKKKHPFMRCIALTVFDKSDYAILKMLEAGANGYVTKTCAAAELEKAILTVHEGRYYFCEAVLKIFPRLAESTIPEHLAKQLSATDVELLKWSRTGKTCDAIARAMNMSRRTVENHYQHLNVRLNVHTRQELAQYARDSGIA